MGKRLSRRQSLQALIAAAGTGLYEILGSPAQLGTAHGSSSLIKCAFFPVVRIERNEKTMAITVPSNVRSFNTSRINCNTQERNPGFLYYPSDTRTVYNDPLSALSYDEWFRRMAEAGVNMVTFRATGRNYTTLSGACMMECPPRGTYNIWDTALDPSAGLPAYRAAQVTHPVDPVVLANSNAQKMVSAAEEHGIGLWITLFEWNEFISRWDEHAWNEANIYIDGTNCEPQDQGFLTNWYEMFDDPTAIQAAKDRIQFFLDTFGSSTAIQVWEILREGVWLCSPGYWGTVWGLPHINNNIRGKMVPWFEEIAQYIRDNDPLERPICPAHVFTQPGGGWPADPDDYWNVVNEINDIPNTEIQSGRGYYDGDVDGLIAHFRAMRTKFPDHTVTIGEYWPFAHGIVPSDEDPPFYTSKEYQWVCACGERNCWGAVRFYGIKERAVNVWISGGAADSDMWDIAAITHDFQDFIDWSLWDDTSSEAWLNHIDTGVAGTDYIMSWGDGRHVMLMIRFATDGGKSVIVSNLTDETMYNVRIFDWVNGLLQSTQQIYATSDGLLSFDYNVSAFHNNILVAYLSSAAAEPQITSVMTMCI